MSGVSKFMDDFGDNLNEDVGLRRTKRRKPVGSKAEGRERMRNAARIQLDRIDVDPQHREEFDEAGIEQLAKSLSDHGQLQPIRVRWDNGRDRYVLIAGERRMRAMRRAGFTEADCVVAEGTLTDTEILTQQIIENCQREDLKPVERAKAFRDLMEQNAWDQKRLAAELHVSQPTVSNSLKLLGLDEETQEKVDSGDITIHNAITSNRKSRKTGGRTKKKAPKPKVFRTKVGRVVVEPKVNQAYVEVLRQALLAAEEVEVEPERRAA